MCFLIVEFELSLDEFVNDVQRFDECDLIGDVLLTGLDDKKFYEGVRTHNVVVKVGDLVRVALDDDDVGYGQVLAIYDEAFDEGEGVHAEVRWFITPDELDTKEEENSESLWKMN